MIPSLSNLGTKVFQGALGLVIVLLCVEAFHGSSGFTARTEQLIHVGIIFCLVVSYIFRELTTNANLKAEQAAHSRATSEMQIEMARSDLRYKNLMEGAGDAIFVINAKNGHLEEMNSMATVLLGYSREELGVLSGKELVPVRDQADFIALVRRVNRHGMASLDRITIKKKDGSRFLGEVNARLIDLGDAKVVQAIVRDITYKWRTEEEIKERNRKLFLLNSIIARVNESLDLPKVLEVTLQETLVAFGPGGGAVHLVVPEQGVLTSAARCNLTEQFASETAQLEYQTAYACPATTSRRCHTLNDPAAASCAFASSAHQAGWKSIVGIPLSAQNHLVGVMHIMTVDTWNHTAEEINFFSTIGNQIGIAIDHARMFTELNQKSEELIRSHALLERSTQNVAHSRERLENNLAVVEQARQELKRIDLMKSNVLGMVSHEFKTPLTGILSGVEFLLSNRGHVADHEERHVLEMIQYGGKQLNEIVTNLLKVMRLEAKNGKVAKKAIRLDGILDSLQTQFKSTLESRHLKIVPCHIDTLPYFYGDRDHLDEIFAELLVNAAKFTPDGGEILISGKVTDRQQLAPVQEVLLRFNPSFYDRMGDQSYLQVEVCDSGIGIAYEEQPKIFDKFYEIGDICHHSSGKHKFMGKGAGLGLAIVKGMVEANGGMVWVESPAAGTMNSVGSSFFVLLPLEEGSNQQAFPFV